MNDLIKNSVDSRKNAIFANYTITDQALLNKINDYFNRLEKFSLDYNDIMEFENAFLASPLNKEYTDLFVDIVKLQTTEEIKEESLQDEILNDIGNRAKADVKQQVYNNVRDIPVIGDALTVKQHFDLFSKFRKQK